MSNKDFEKANNLPILDVLTKAGISYKKSGSNKSEYNLIRPDGSIDKSFGINSIKNLAIDFGKSGIKGGPFDFIGRYLLKLDTQSTEGRKATIEWFYSSGMITRSTTKKKFEKSLGDMALFESFDKYKLGGFNSVISKFLGTRGVDHDFIKDNNKKIGELFKDFGYYDNYYCTEHKTFKDEKTGKWINKEGDKPKNTGVIMFPCLKKGKREGMILRRVDGKTIRGKKSVAVNATGLRYDFIGKKTVLIVEGMPDRIILKLLGFNSVVCNSGGVQYGKEELKNLLFETGKNIFLYDNDEAGSNAKQLLLKEFNREIFEIKFPKINNTEGQPLTDINDYYKAGYNTKQRWGGLFSKAKAIEKTDEKKSRFIYLDNHLEFFDTKTKSFVRDTKLANHLKIKSKDLIEMRGPIIPEYADLCYRDGGKPLYYNTFRKETILNYEGCEPKYHPDIKKLFDNLCNYSEINIKWLHQAILYKYNNLNDVLVPATIFFGPGASGKGTLLNLLTQIFGEENTLIGLGQKDLESSFSTYSGEKIIVEFKEVSSGNKFNDKKILDRIKSFVGEEKIQVRKLYQNSIKVDNIAWFIMSSNHVVPIQLDSRDSGNRRFTIIKTGKNININEEGKIDLNIGYRINKTIKENIQAIKEFLAYLHETYPEVLEWKTIAPLENEEKQNLEDTCESVANKFFKWFEDKYPDIYKITNREKTLLVNRYMIEVGHDEFNDIRYKHTNFDAGLSHKIIKKHIRIRDKTKRGYYINKIPSEMQRIKDAGLSGEFKIDDIEDPLYKTNL